MLAGLDDDQRTAVLAPRGPVCILAGAGTGKTRAITHRIAHGVVTGATAARIGGAPILRATSRVVVGGGLALAATYLIGTLLGTTNVV